MEIEQMKERMHQLIVEQVFVKNKDEQIDVAEGPDRWLFDFRRVLMESEHANTIAELFYDSFKDTYPFQLCSLEVAGVPLMTAIMMKFYERGHTDINSFFVRKSRKKTNLMRMIEGNPKSDIPVILVDDIMNSGNSFWRQIEALEALELKITTVWSVLRFRDVSYHKRLTNRGIAVLSLFELNDFTKDLGNDVSNLVWEYPKPPNMPFETKWIYSGPNPTYKWVVQKSQPVLDEEKIYVGADDEYFRAINQQDGSVAWTYKVGPGSLKKSIFSSPKLYNNLVIFGSYDGNVYGLQAETGEEKWKFIEADWVGSSPSIAYDLGIVFIGLEFGLFNKRGGIVALDAQTGKKIWSDYSHPAYTHCSPFYIQAWSQVVIGSNDGVVRLYDAKTGVLLWSFTTFGGATYNPDTDAGFSEGDIKESFVYDEKHDVIIFGSVDGFLYFVNRKTGHLVHHYRCIFGIWSSPVIHKNKVYFTSVDKHVRCIDLNTHELIFDVNLDNTRIFSSPAIINDRLYVGTNAARLHEIDPDTGEKLGYFQATERITNNLVFNPKTEKYFLPTYANQIICLERRIDTTE